MVLLKQSHQQVVMQLQEDVATANNTQLQEKATSKAAMQALQLEVEAPKTRSHTELAAKQRELDMAINEKSALESRFRCGVCYETYLEYLLTCGHAFCTSCVDHEAREDAQGVRRVRCLFCNNNNSRFTKLYI